MGKSQRDKGCREERSIVALFKEHGIGAKRVPLSGAADGFKGDVLAQICGQEWKIESKVRKGGFKLVYDYLEGNDALIIRQDRQEHLIVISLEKFLNILVEGW